MTRIRRPVTVRHGCTLLSISMIFVFATAVLDAEDIGLPIAELQRDSEVNFETEILPILRRNCLACHNASDAESELVLETPAAILKGGVEGTAAIAGKAEDSLLLQIASHRTEPIMPPEDNEAGAKNLTPEELALIKLWIDQGARGEVTGQAAAIDWQPLPGSVNPIFAAAVSRYGDYVAAGRANQIFVYHVGAGKSLGRLTDPALLKQGTYSKPGVAHLDLVQSLAFSPDGHWLASGGFRNVKLWRRRQIVHKSNWPEVDGNITAFVVSRDGKWGGAGTDTGHVYLIDVAANQLVRSLGSHGSAVRSMGYSASGNVLVAAFDDLTLRCFNSSDGSQLGHIITSTAVAAVALVVDDSQVATGGADNTIRLWPLVTADRAAFSDEQQQEQPPGADGPSVPVTKPLAELPGHSGAITSLVANPADSRQLISGSQDGTIRIWNLSETTQIRQLDHGGPVTAVDASPDGQRIASTADDRTTKLWNAADGKLVAELRGDYHVRLRVEDARRAVELAKRHVSNAKGDLDGKNKRKADEEKNVKSAEEGLKKAAEELKQKDEASQKAAKAKDEAIEAANAARNELNDLEAVKQKADLALQAASEENRKAAEDAKTTAEKQLDEARKQIEATEKKAKDLAEAAEKAVNEKNNAQRTAEAAQRSVARSQESLEKAAAEVPAAETALKNSEQHQKMREETLAQRESAAKEAERVPRAIAFAPDGSELAVSDEAGKLHTFASESGSPIEVFSGLDSRIVGLGYTARDKLLAVGEGGSFVVWKTLPEWQLERTIGSTGSPDALQGRVTALGFAPDGTTLATGAGEPSRSGQLRLWNVEDGQLKAEIENAHSDTVFGLEFSPDGKQLASCGADRFMKVFDIASGQIVRSFEGHTHHVLGVSWRADGRVLATCGADNVIKVWDALTGDQQKSISGFDKELTSIQFLGLQDVMVVSAGSNTVASRKTDGGGGPNFLGAADFMYTVRCSADGQSVVAGGQDSVVRVWDKDGKPVTEFSPPNLAADL